MLEVDKPADTHSTNEKLEFMMSVEQKEWLMAVMSGDEKKMMNMLNTNPDLVNWQSALHFAAKFGNCALIRMLVGNHHADVNIRNNGLTPLHWAAASAQKDAIILLTSTYGAKITIRDHSGQLPGAYLPPSKTGNELKSKLPVTVRIDQQDPLLTLLAKKAPRLSVLEHWISRLRERRASDPT